MALRFNKKKIFQEMHDLMDTLKSIPYICLSKEMIHQSLEWQGYTKKCGNFFIHPQKCVAIEIYLIQSFDDEAPPNSAHLFGMNYTAQLLFSSTTLICNLRDADMHTTIIHSDVNLDGDESNALLFPFDT